MTDRAPEKSVGQMKSLETPARVLQPTRIEGILSSIQVGSILEEVNRISESAPGGPGEQGSAASGARAAASTGSGSTAISPRDLAIAAIPEPAILQQRLAQHIRTEVKTLRKQAQAIARASEPGAAFHLNRLYARIRRLNALLTELLEASYEVLKRLFIRVFIDRQPIL